jgi:Ca-activated chloride channel family protein
MVIDHSSSMKFDNKLAFVLATIEFCISQLESHHRFSLIMFNHQVTQITNGLIPMTPENKSSVLSKLQTIEATGSTNIGDALITALDVLNTRQDTSILSSVMLFSDGLSNAGLSSGELQNVI